MPTGPLTDARAVLHAVLGTRPRRILDLGMGTGKWGYLIRDQVDLAENRPRVGWTLTIDGVEAFPEYVGDHQRSVYDTIVVGDALEFLRAYDGERYDVALVLDIVEHFEPQRGVELVVLALDAADFVVLTTPKRFYAQRWESNPLENHLSWWPRSGLNELARRAGAHASIAQTLDTNIAVLSRRAKPAPIETQRVRAVVAMLRDRFVPELAWYRLRRKSGPTL